MATWTLFIQGVVTAEHWAPPTPPNIPSCSSSSLINLALRFWPASHDVEGAGLSDHPPRGEAFVCPPSRHLLLFMPPASFSEAIFQLPYNNEESILIEVFKALRLMVALGVNFCLVLFFFSSSPRFSCRSPRPSLRYCLPFHSYYSLAFFCPLISLLTSCILSPCVQLWSSYSARAIFCHGE